MLIESFLHSERRVYGSLGCSDWGSMARISLKEYVAASMYGIESEGRHDTVLVFWGNIFLDEKYGDCQGGGVSCY